MRGTLRQLKRFMVGLVGGTILLIGVVMVVLPGPAILIIPLGLGILATEFVWARRLYTRIKERLHRKREPSRTQE